MIIPLVIVVVAVALSITLSSLTAGTIIGGIEYFRFERIVPAEETMLKECSFLTSELPLEGDGPVER